MTTTLPLSPQMWQTHGMFNLIRQIIGKVLLLADQLTAPAPLQRGATIQAQMDERCRPLALYEMEACPFCIKVRRELRRLNLNIERRDVKKNQAHQDALMAGGKEDQVPCLRIDDAGAVRWLYESDEIIGYLKKQFAS